MPTPSTVVVPGLETIGTVLTVSSVVRCTGKAVELLAVVTASRTGCICVITELGGAGASGCACRSAVLENGPDSVQSGGASFLARPLVPVLVEVGLELRVAGAAEAARVAAERAIRCKTAVSALPSGPA